MTPEEITRLVDGEIAANPSHGSPPGLDLRRSLVTPRKLTYEDGFLEGRTRELRLVLDEHPDADAGYQIVFDERSWQFGLAAKDTGARVFIGYHGTFLDTLDGL
ncbi:MAG: hypothetical protein ACREI3_00125 [Nitrospirales bacterium]